MINNTVTCLVCKKAVSVYGYSNHMRYSHNVFGAKCTEESKDIFEGSNRTNNPRKECKFNYNGLGKTSIPLEVHNRVIQDHLEENMTLKDISTKYDISYHAVVLLFKKYGIVVKNRNIEINKENTIKKSVSFLESDLGKKIISEYVAEGGTIRGICAKYGLYRRTFRRCLTLIGVNKKSGKIARNEVTKAKGLYGERHPRFGKGSPVGSGKCGWFFYNNVKYQGSWEFKVGLWFIKNNVEFLCHKGVPTFRYSISGKTHTYCPDFYLPKLNKYVEVKGFFTDYDRNKIDIIRREYPEITLEILDKKYLMNNGILTVDKELGIDIQAYRLNTEESTTYYEGLLSKIDPDILIKSIHIDRVSWSKKAKELNVPIQVFSSYVKRLVPEAGSHAYYEYLYNKYLPVSVVRDMISAGVGIYSIYRKATEYNGIPPHRNYGILKEVIKCL